MTKALVRLSSSSPSCGRVPTFYLRVAVMGCMTDNAHDVGLTPLCVDGVAHDFAVDGQALVASAMGLVPALQGLIERHRIDTHEDIANDRFARHHAASVLASATETLARFTAKALRPVRDCFVTTHPTERRPGGDGQNHRHWMASSLRAARV